MNNPNNLRSPRASLPGMSINSQLGDVAALQQSLLEKDKQISDLQGTINRLELKNKEYSSYQQAMIQYEARTEEVQGELLKTNEKLRAKVGECEQLKKKLDQELKQKKERSTSYVRHEDYMKLSNDFKKFRDAHRSCQNSIKAMQKQNQEVDGYISQLKEQINSLNNIIAAKNTEINDLKVQKYQARSAHSIESQKDLVIRNSSNIISSFKILGQEPNNPNNPQPIPNETQKMNYELLTYNRQNDQLRKRVQKLQQELQQALQSSTESSTIEQNNQHARIISEYEASLSAMANKLTAVHRLEMERNTIQGDRRKFQVQCEQLRQELASRASYCEGLEKKIREIQHYKMAYMKTDLENFVTRNEKLTRQVERLEKSVIEKYELIVQLKKNFMAVQITEQTFRLIEQNLTQLETALNQTKLQLSKEQDKLMQKEQQHFKLQKDLKHAQIELAQVKSQMAKTNRVVSQKVQKIEFQTTEIKRLEKENAEKKELSGKLAALEIEFKKLEKKYEEQIDQSNELAMSVIILSAEIERKDITGNITKQFITEFQALKIKSKQTENHAKYLEERVKRLEHLHKQVVMESMKISEHLHLSHKRWNHYDTSMERLLQFLEESNQRSNKRYEELDANIGTWLTLQDQRLKELAKADPLGEIPQYVTYTAKITTEPLKMDNQN